MYNALTSPPMPEWNALRNEDRASIIRAWEDCCCSHGCGEPSAFYGAIREALVEREKYYLQCTMAS